jgi:hypothetical protein
MTERLGADKLTTEKLCLGKGNSRGKISGDPIRMQCWSCQRRATMQSDFSKVIPAPEFTNDVCPSRIAHPAEVESSSCESISTVDDTFTGDYWGGPATSSSVDTISDSSSDD